MSTYHDNTDILRRRADILKRELYSQCLHQIELWADFGEYLCMTDSTENATPPKSTRSKAPDSSVSRGTNSHWDFGLIWMCTKRFEFLDSVGFGRVAWICHTRCMHSWQKKIPPTGESSQKWTKQSAWMTNWVVISLWRMSVHSWHALKIPTGRRIVSNVSWTLSVYDKLSSALTLENVCALMAYTHGRKSFRRPTHILKK